MKTVDFIREHNACYDVAKWALSISDDMAVVWDAMIEQNRHAWLLWAVTRPGVFTDSTLRKLACRFVRETPVSNGRTVWDLLTDERSRKAIEVTEAYVDGNATKKELVAAAAAASDAAAASYDTADAAAAYAAAAYAAASASRAARAARAAVCAVGYVARAAADAARAAARAAYWDADAAQVRMVAELGNPFKEENQMRIEVTKSHSPQRIVAEEQEMEKRRRKSILDRAVRYLDWCVKSDCRELSQAFPELEGRTDSERGRELFRCLGEVLYETVSMLGREPSQIDCARCQNVCKSPDDGRVTGCQLGQQGACTMYKRKEIRFGPSSVPTNFGAPLTEGQTKE